MWVKECCISDLCHVPGPVLVLFSAVLVLSRCGPGHGRVAAWRTTVATVSGQTWQRWLELEAQRQRDQIVWARVRILLQLGWVPAGAEVVRGGLVHL